jgi:hypothetical protein
MSLHFHDSLFAHFSFAQGKSIRCLCFAQLRTSFRLADNVASSADVRRDQRRRGLQVRWSRSWYSPPTITKYGPDIGYQRRGMIYWAVLSRNRSQRGELAGHYVGASAGVTFGPGVHANALVGGNKIMLNPMSFGDANGINVAATMTDLQLVYAGPGGRRY